MYIKEIRIKNFRNFKDLTIPLNRFTILIGENDIEEYLTTPKNKTEAIYKICEEILENKIQIELPKHIKEIIDKVCEKAKYKLQELEQN